MIKKHKKNYIMHWWPLTKWEKLHIFCAHLIIQKNYVYLCTQSLQLSTGPFGPDICWEIENSEQRIFWYFWDMFTTITFQELELLTLIAWSSCIGFAHWLVSSIFSVWWKQNSESSPKSSAAETVVKFTYESWSHLW